MSEQILTERQAVVRRGLWLNYATLAYNAVESVVGLAAGLAAGSVALIGFGADSLIELAASSTALWRLHSDHRVHHRDRNERIAQKLIGAGFVALATGVAFEAGRTLWLAEAPDESFPGIVLAGMSVVVMPLLARAKRRVADSMRSGALASEATQTMLCAYLSAILLGGLLLNATVGWWWADPLAALAMVPIIGREGWETFHGRSDCGCH